MNKAYIDQECVMCQTYGNFLQKRSSNISIKNQLELSKEDIERDEIVYERDNLRFYGAEAFIQSTYDLGGFYKVIFALKIFPKIFRDIIYKFISKNRHRIFKSFFIFSIFRAIYGFFIVIFAYYFSRELSLNVYETGMIFIFSIFLSRIGYKAFKNKFNL